MIDPVVFDRDAVAGFMPELFGQADGDRVLSAAMPDGWRSWRFGPAEVGAAVDWAAGLSRRARGLYVRMTTVNPAAAFTGRGLGEHSHELVCLWADLDYGSTGHRPGPGALPLPPDADAALKLLDGLPAPSVLVDSGHGLHGYWLLVEPVLITEDNRQVVQASSTAWHRAMKTTGERMGLGYGPGVGDLARVLRLPGTANRKVEPERACRVLERTGERFTFAQLLGPAEAILGSPVPPRPELTAPSGWASVHPAGPGPFDVLDELATWADVMESAGWTRARCTDAGVAEAWKRPGGTHPVSAKVLQANPHVLVVHSEDAGLPTGGGQKLTKGRVYAHLHHAGDEAAAARALRSGEATGLPAALSARIAPPTQEKAEPVPVEPTTPNGERRRLELTRAADIAPRRVRWLWSGRFALGTLALVSGREGLGKSSVCYWLTAQVTRGTLPGEHEGQPRAVLVCATEDSWAHTIVPRLIAAGADLERVYRVEMVSDAVHVGLSLPRDLAEVRQAAEQTGAALLILDPLLSRLDGSLDTHRDAEVRRALEPLSELADGAGLVVLGLIHHNKSATGDPLTAVMGSRAFVAVARSVHTVVADPEDDTGSRKLFGTVKNNLGRADLPTLGYVIESYAVPTAEGDAWTGRVAWGEDAQLSIGDAMHRAARPETATDREDRDAAEEWLEDYLSQAGGSRASTEVKKAARAAGHTDWAVRQARQRLRLLTEAGGYPRVTTWTLPDTIPSGEASCEDSPRGECVPLTTTTTEPVSPSGVVVRGCESPRTPSHHRHPTGPGSPC